MELSRDALIYMALMLDLPEILSLCESSSKINKIVCQNQEFWYNKIKREYPEKNIDNKTNYRETYKTLYMYPVKINLVINFQLDGENNTFSYPIVINESDKITDIGKYILYIVSVFSDGILINNKFKFYIHNRNKPEISCEAIPWNNNKCLKNINYTTEKVVVDMDIEDEMDMSLNVERFNIIVDYVKNNYLKGTNKWGPLWL